MNRGLDCDVLVAEVYFWINITLYLRRISIKSNITLNKNYYLNVDIQVRATSHKPDEIYGMIERLTPGLRKIELFGRPHNVQPNW